MPEEDLVVELLHFDPDNYKLEHEIRDGRATVIAVEALTHDIRRLELEVAEPADFSFLPGQYVDVWVPESDARRSFSMANLPGDGRIELIVKRYPGGRFSSLLDGAIAVGDELRFTGPYGAFHLRESERPVLMVAGGSGMAPILSLLRALADAGTDRPVRFFYGARSEQDLFYVDLVQELGGRLPDFEFVPVIGFVHEPACACIAEGELSDPEIYMCGPPPMIDAMIELATDRHGIDERSRIFHDKFTTSADAVVEPAKPARYREAGDGGWSRTTDQVARQRGRTSRRRPRALVPVVHAEEAPRHDVRGRHGRHASRPCTATSTAAGPSTSRTAAGSGRTTRPACARPTGMSSATRARCGSAPSTTTARRTSS